MSEREKAIQILQTLPDTVSLKEIIKTLSMMLEINSRIDSCNEDELITTEQIKKEIEKW